MQVFPETLRIRVAKWIDEYLGRWLLYLCDCLRSSAPRKRCPEAVTRVLVIKFWGLGSIILAEPALRYLRKKYPAARLDFLTLAQNRELFVLIPHVDRVHTIKFGSPVRVILSALLLIAKLRRERYEIIFDAEFFANFSALVGRLAAPACLIGFSRAHDLKSRVLDVAVAFRDDQHAAQNFLRLVMGKDDPVGSVDDDRRTWPRLTAPFVRFTNGRRPCVVMNVNASPLALERRWPRARFAQLAKWLLQNYDIDLILIGSRAEQEYTLRVAAAIGACNRVTNLAGALTLPELTAKISTSDIFISNDSGPLHLAAALRKPVVGFYGPETPGRFGPLCPARLVFYLDLPCSPCMSVDNAKTVNCTNQQKCLRDLTPAMVIPRLRRFIDERALLPRRRASEVSRLITFAEVHDA